MKLKLIILISAIFTACILNLSSCAQSKGTTTEVIILHTNDMHSKIDNFGKLAYLADSLRKLHPYVFLVAAGDNFTGNPIVDMYPDKGYPMIDLMNRVGFNVSAMGNHEFDLGQQLHNKRRKQAKFPFICCNMDASKAIVEQPKPYIFLKAGKIKIPVLGIIQLGQNGIPDSHPSKMEGIKFTDGLKKAGEYMWLKQKYGSLIALTHLGVEGDEPLAKRYPQLDLIIGGHSHTTISTPMLVNGVMIVQAGSQLKYAGKTTLVFKGNKIESREDELIQLDKIKGVKPEIQALIDKYNDNPEMNKVVAVAETAFSNEEELGCLMTDAITARFKLDFAFQNGGGIRISSLPKGDIKMKDVFRLDPFGNQVVTYTMTLDEIKSLICNSFNRSNAIDLAVSGMIYTIKKGGSGQCADVEMSDLAGNPLDASKTYTVGMNSYIASSYHFNHKDPGTTNFNTSAQTLLDHLLDVKKVRYAGVKRAFVK